jgi:integrase
MSPQLAAALQKHIEKRGKSSQFLFTNSAGGHIDHSNFSKKWRKVQEDLGITPRSPHNTRHTFATLMISRGENIAFVSKIFGHSSIKVLNKELTHFQDLHTSMPSNQGQRLNEVVS